MPVLNTLATRMYDGTRTYGDVVHFVHIYVIEPHPIAPHISPYTGDVWEANYSTKPQAYTYDERVANAQDIGPLLQGTQLLLIDDLTPGSMNNPLWCTYGPCPNCAYLIRQDGVIDTVQNWVDPDQMQNRIDLLVQ